ncbi:MAG: putative Ig domain-containing protein [Acidobacteriaceae bacterium]
MALFTGCGGGGNSTTTQQLNPPVHLAYPQTSIVATVGVAISVDTPTVSGTVTTWSIAPALPAGLSFSTSTGSISGAPTQASASGTYTITATNSAGSTTSTLTIAVAAAQPPPGISYPQTTINAFVGRAIAADIPTITAVLGTLSISPALPIGLTLNPDNGVISGTPGAASPQTVYTVTGPTSKGNVSATVTITVTAPVQKTLLELGHGVQILAIRETADRLLSEDISGHWVLWDASTHAIITSGDNAITADANQIGLAGSLAVVATASGIQVMSETDGSSVFTIPASPSWWKIATDGSYIVTGSSSGLTAWSSSGANLFTQSGNYASAIAFAAPGQVQIANGPAAASVIQTISVPSGSSVTSAPYLGTFSSWFGDGGRFITNTANTVWIYSSAGTEQQLLSLPSTNNLAGVGSWVWCTTTVNVITGKQDDDALQIYQVGQTTPTVTYDLSLGSTYVLSGTTLAAFGSPQFPDVVELIDLSGTSPAQIILGGIGVPIPAVDTFAAASATQWVMGNSSGALQDGAGLTGSELPSYFGYGAALSIAGSPGFVSVATASGQILSWNLSGPTRVSTIEDLPAAAIELTSDGSTLAVGSIYGDLSLYSVASGTLTHDYGISGDFSLAANGQVLAELGSPLQVIDVSTGSTLWSASSNSHELQLSPDGSLLGAVLQAEDGTYSTNLYNDSGTLTTAVPGFTEGWIDTGRLLAWSVPAGTPTQVTTSIYSSTGAVLTTFPVNAMPAASQAQFPSSSQVYFSGTNTVQSLTDGSIVWQGPIQNGSPGAVAGPYIAYQWGHQVVLYSY